MHGGEYSPTGEKTSENLQVGKCERCDRNRRYRRCPQYRRRCRQVRPKQDSWGGDAMNQRKDRKAIGETDMRPSSAKSSCRATTCDAIAASTQSDAATSTIQNNAFGEAKIGRVTAARANTIPAPVIQIDSIQPSNERDATVSTNPTAWWVEDCVNL
jgi:hypothetical protein